MSYSGEAYEVVLSFGHVHRFERIKADMTLFLFDLSQHLLDSGCLDLGQPSGLDDGSDTFCRG
jgi:hypothetical protein